jgi:hypothetical protein
MSAPDNFITPLFGPVDPTTRIWTLTYIETMEWLGYSVDTGELVWGPVKGAELDFTYYGSGRGGGQIGFCAYGNLYTQGFGGEIVAFSMADGKVLWKYNNTNSGDETVWGNYPIFISAIADGKVYAFNNEHSPNYPLYKGERVRCINASNGAELWTMLGWAGQSGGPGTATSILADGFLTYYSYYDNQIYSIGKGPSTTTVEAPLQGITQGQSIVIQGTVTDQSSGAKKKVQTGEFSVVPAVSDESMGKWMEYIYMQKPKPADAKGVPVKLTAVDPNGNAIDIAIVTSETSGLYSYAWVPTIPGKYTITATFAGSNSYWPSSAQAAISVDAKPQASPITPPPTATPTPTGTISPTASPSMVSPPPGYGLGTEYYIAIAAVIIIIAIAAVAVILRRRK